MMPTEQAASQTQLTAGERQSQASNPQHATLTQHCPREHEARGQQQSQYLA